MIKRGYGAIILIAVFIFTAFFSVPVYANSAAPPSLTIVVLNAPDEIEIYSADGTEKAYREFSLSDPLFRFYESGTFPNAIVIRAEGRETLLELPAENISGYDKYAVLDYKAMKLSVGQPAWRPPLLIFLRVSFTLIIEGVIFLLFGFRTKRDAAVFLTVNILTQAALNVIILTETNTAFLMVELIFLEIIIFIIEAVAYCLLFTERSKAERVVFSFIANLASLFIGGAAIYLLPF